MRLFLSVSYIFLAVFLALFIFAAEAKANITIPDYSFTGEELSDFAPRPAYTIINFNFSEPNKMDSYLQRSKLEFDEADKKGYESKDPGFMYSGTIGTAISSIFVGGEKAYRNNIVRAYLKQSYLDVLSSYDKYKEFLEKSIFNDETSLIYALSLYQTGSQKEAFKILSGLALGEGIFNEIAQDSLFKAIDNVKKYDDLEPLAKNLKKFSPYSLSVWIKYLDGKNRYEEMLAVLERHTEYEKTNKNFIEARAVALYHMKKYDEVVALIGDLRDTYAYPIAIDALIMKGDVAEARKRVQTLQEDSNKLMLETKIAIASGELELAGKNLKNIKNDDDKLSLFFYSVNNYFKYVTPAFLAAFTFKDRQYNDYLNYYSGLKHLSNKEYMQSIAFFSRVVFNKNLLLESYFYQGMANLMIDNSRAVFYFTRYIEISKDQNKIKLAKFMVAQLSFINDSYDEALKLIGGCEENYCKVLRADIYLAMNDFNSSLRAAADVKDERAYLIRATDYYNLRDYDRSLEELALIPYKNDDAKYLTMMNYFKLNRVSDALKLVDENGTDKFLTAAAAQLVLAGNTTDALKYLDGVKKRSPEDELALANLLLAEGKNKEAQELYTALLAKDKEVYGAYTGLYQVAIVDNRSSTFLDDSYKSIESRADFIKRDKLLVDFTAKALEQSNLRIARRYLALYNSKYTAGEYKLSALTLQARLNSADGRFRDCLDNIDAAFKLPSENKDELSFIKAECLENSKRDDSLSIYRQLAVKDNRFYQLATRKIIELSPNSDEILNYSHTIKPYSFDIYKLGIMRFMRIANNEEYKKNEPLILSLSVNAVPEIRSYALQRIGKASLEEKNYDKAAQYYMKAFYLFGNDENKFEILSGAKDAYDAKGEKAESEKVVKLMTQKVAPK